jgi:hypothetical protein
VADRWGEAVGRDTPGTAAMSLPVMETKMEFADLCLFLGIVIAFATLVVKVIELSRKD